jgi:type II secretion system protein J
MRIKRSQRTSAFTLIEIMVALGIFGMVLTAIYATWSAILRSSKLGTDVAAQIQRDRVAVRTLEEALTSARSFEADVEHYGFLAQNGNQAALSFVARLPQSFPRSGKFGDFDVRRVTFSVESGPSFDRQLVLRQNPILMDVDADEQEHPLVLARHVQEFSVELWDLQLGDWVDEWKLTNQLPKLVKFTLRLGFAEGGYAYSQSGANEEVTRLIALPSITVPAMWQVPRR